MPTHSSDPESLRLADADSNAQPWKRWGPYLSDRQWATVREDYSEHGNCWDHFPHDHARSRAYRWGEDGLLGICDDESRLCFALALWNGKDPILKERLFGLTGPEGNHGEDVKEHYFYLDSTPTHSYMKALYKYPHAEFPYAHLVHENRRRSKHQPEFEFSDTGVFDSNRYFDVHAEYAKASPDDTLIRITLSNRGPDPATLHVLPTLWFRNTWSWGCRHNTPDACGIKPMLKSTEPGRILASHQDLGNYILAVDSSPAGVGPDLLFTENESNAQRLWNTPNATPYVKDAFHDRVVHNITSATNPHHFGTKAAAWYNLTIPAQKSVTLRLRLSRAAAAPAQPFAPRPKGFDAIFDARIREADAFYNAPPRSHADLPSEERTIARQAAAGLLWSKQFYHLDIRDWLQGDPSQPAPPAARHSGRNADWAHLNNKDIISMPDKWEYPWYAAWDLAFQMIPFARLDPQFAKDQLVLMLREWYMHPNGQLPAYEFAFGDVNPPVHAWAVWRVYKMTGEKGHRDRTFLARCFQKLLLNFTWWVNRKDPTGKNLFSGGFLGLDNIGVFDRSKPLPTGGHLEQADGTAWMAFYCGTMLSIALELAAHDPAYEDIATKFFEHFIAITDAMNSLGGTGLWDDHDAFYYDQIRMGDAPPTPLRVRSLVGIVPLLAVEILESDTIDKLPDFKRRMEWFLKNRTDLPWAQSCSCAHAPPPLPAGEVSRKRSERDGGGAFMPLPEGGVGVGFESPATATGSAATTTPSDAHDESSNRGASSSSSHRLLAIPSRDRLQRVVQRLMDESEFLSPFGIRSLSKHHDLHPFILHIDHQEHRVDYTPGESTNGLFGGNSNWRGPIWFPLNFLIVEALERYHHYYANDLTIEFPANSGRHINLQQAADEIRARLARLFLPDRKGHRPCHASDPRFATDPHWKDLVYFYEHFHPDTGRGLGASHQTGWTALIYTLLRKSGSPHATHADTPEVVVKPAARTPVPRRVAR